MRFKGLARRFLSTFAMLGAIAASASAQEPYSAYKSLTCTQTHQCIITFPSVSAAKRLEIHHAACGQVVSPTTSEVTFLGLYIMQGAAIRALFALVAHPQGATASNEWWAADSPILAHVAAGQRPVVNIFMVGDVTTQTLSCTLTGYTFPLS